MKASRAVWIAVLLPLITAPWLFPPSANAAWGGVPTWVVYAVAATGALALLIAGWVGSWWSRLADEAERAARPTAAKRKTS